MRVGREMVGTSPFCDKMLRRCCAGAYVVCFKKSILVSPAIIMSLLECRLTR